MKKLYFSLKSFRRLVYVFFVFSTVLTFFWGFSIYYLFITFSSFSEGASLLAVYLEKYYVLRVSKLSNLEKIKEAENLIGGFIVFYDLLKFRDRDYDEIVRVWRDFGMTDNEIFVVVLGTRVFRIIPGLMDEIRASAEQIYEVVNNLSVNFNEEEEEILSDSVRGFIQAFTNTMRIAVLYFVVSLGIGVVYWVAGFGFFIIRYVERLKVIVEAISKSIYSFIKDGKIEKIDILSDESKELFVLQEAANSVMEKGDFLISAISELENRLIFNFEALETNYYTIYEASAGLKNLLSNLSGLDKEKIEQNINSLSKTFSLLQRYTQDIKGMFEEFRSKVENIFEPIETLYDIISKASEDYRRINETVGSYLKESNMFVKVISESLKKQSDELEKGLVALRKIALSLKNIGINATVEFSKVSSEALFQVSRKIIDTSKNLQDIVLETSMFIEEIRNDVLQNLDKVDSFYLVVDELLRDMDGIYGVVKSLLSDKEKTIENIRHNYEILSSIYKLLDEVDKVSQNMNSVYYTLENNIKSLISLADLRDEMKSIIEILDAVCGSLEEVRLNLSKLIEELRKYK